MLGAADVVAGGFIFDASPSLSLLLLESDVIDDVSESSADS